MHPRKLFGDFGGGKVVGRGAVLNCIWNPSSTEISHCSPDIIGAKVQQKERQMVLQIGVKGRFHSAKVISLPVLLLHLTKEI